MLTLLPCFLLQQFFVEWEVWTSDKSQASILATATSARYTRNRASLLDLFTLAKCHLHLVAEAPSMTLPLVIHAQINITFTSNLPVLLLGSPWLILHAFKADTKSIHTVHATSLHSLVCTYPARPKDEKEKSGGDDCPEDLIHPEPVALCIPLWVLWRELQSSPCVNSLLWRGVADHEWQPGKQPKVGATENNWIPKNSSFSLPFQNSCGPSGAMWDTDIPHCYGGRDQQLWPRPVK